MKPSLSPPCGEPSPPALLQAYSKKSTVSEVGLRIPDAYLYLIGAVREWAEEEGTGMRINTRAAQGSSARLLGKVAAETCAKGRGG